MAEREPTRRPGRLRRMLRREEGQASFEFLMVLPIFVLWLLLVIDFGILMYQYVSVSNAVREGARYGAVNCGDGDCTQSEIVDRVLERSGGILGAGDSGDVAVGWIDNSTTPDTNSGRGDSIVVRVEHDYSFLFFPATIPVTSCADMRLEQRDGTSGLPAGSGC